MVFLWKENKNTSVKTLTNVTDFFSLPGLHIGAEGKKRALKHNL